MGSRLPVVVVKQVFILDDLGKPAVVMRVFRGVRGSQETGPEKEQWEEDLLGH